MIVGSFLMMTTSISIQAFDLSHEGEEHEAFASLAQEIEGLSGCYA